MRRTALFVLLACAVGCAAPPLGAQLALTHANVVDVERGVVLTDRTVLISGNRIVAVGAGVRVPAGARVHDARGKYVIPGLWDMHVHNSREGRALHFWPLFLAHGVTGVREMGSYLDSLQHWRAAARRPGSGAPRIVWSSPMLDGVPTSWVHGYGVPDAARARITVDTMQRLGFDFLKVYDRLSRDAYLAIAAEAKRRGIPFSGHVPRSVTAVEASDAGQRSFEHITDALSLACTPRGAELLDAFVKARESLGPDADSTRAALGRLRTAVAAGPVEDACRPTFARMVANGTWLTPTLAVTHGQVPPDALVADPRLRFVPPGLAARWRSDHAAADPDELRFGRRMEANAWRLVGLAQRAGVGILAGTDASDEAYVFAGSGVHDELALLVRAGLSPIDALRAATLNPARYLGAADSLGTVAPGRLADLVLLDANPLADIRNTTRIHAVVANGRLIDARERARLLAHAAAAAARSATAPPARR
jgi:imidazolonepropionase-like amidohydrolase